MNQEKLKHFASDEAMNSAVYSVLLESFLSLSRSVTDVQFLAASRIAINLLEEAWKEIERYKVEERKEESESRQIGL